MRCLPLFLILVGLFNAVFGVPQVSAGESSLLHALVIGNADYAVGKLKNPRNDAELIGTALKGLGFEVTLRFDLTHREMDEAISEFGRQVPRNGLAFLYYAGHGLEIDGRNYLIPIDAELTDVASVKYKTVPQGLVLDSLATSSSNMNVLVLDCCRDNPFRSISRGFQSRGLAAPYESIPEGMLIAYATAPGEVAADGVGDHSPFAKAMADALNRRPSRGLLLRDVFFYAGAAVKKSTGQRPWLHIEPSIDDFFLRRPAGTADPDKPEIPVPTAPVATKPEPALVSSTQPLARPTQQPEGQTLSSVSLAPLENKKADSPAEDRLLQQARRFAKNGQLTLAIESYAAVIDDSTRSEPVRHAARLGRGAAYLNQGNNDDFGRALIDFQAAGKEGFRRAVLRPNASLEVESRVVASLRPGQIAFVTKSHGDWFWVHSVDDDSTTRGWIKPEAFLGQNAKSEQSIVGAKDRQDVVSTPGQNASTVTTTTQPTLSPAIGTSNQHVVSSSGNTSFGASHNVVPNRVVNSGTIHGSTPAFSGQPVLSSSSGQSTPFTTQSVRSFQQPTNRVPSNQVRQSFNGSHSIQRSGNTGRSVPSGADPWTKRFMQKHGRAPSIWQTPRWESPAEIRSLRARGLVR